LDYLFLLAIKPAPLTFKVPPYLRALFPPSLPAGDHIHGYKLARFSQGKLAQPPRLSARESRITFGHYA
jgi:hypothetical protein